MAKAPNRRRFNGSCTASISPITVPTLAVALSTKGGALVTDTFVVISPTSSLISITAFWSTNNLIPVNTADLKPVLSTVRL